jgi:hypothetical protein
MHVWSIWNIPLLAAKLWSTVAVLFLSLVCSFLPFGIRSRFKNSKTFMSYLNCLAGGVVFGALMMHMIPEITHVHHATPSSVSLPGHGSTSPHLHANVGDHHHHHHDGDE